MKKTTTNETNQNKATSSRTGFTQKTVTIMFSLAIGLAIAPLGIVAAMGEVYEDATSEFMEANGQIINMYEVHEDKAITITSVADNSGNVLYEDEMGEFFANAGYNLTEFRPEGGRNGELLIVADPVPQQQNVTELVL